MSESELRVLMASISDTSEAPRGKNIFYRCRACGGLVPSIPSDNVGCSCGNVFVDVDYHRLAVRDYSAFEAIAKVRK